MDTERKSRKELAELHGMEMVNRASQVAALALAPNANLQEGVAILLRNGDIVVGGNSHNASLCAVSVALRGLHARRIPLRDVVALLYYGGEETKGPCANCLKELAPYNTADDPIPISIIRNGVSVAP